MANADRPRGLRPIANMRIRWYQYNSTTAIFDGDPLELKSNGRVRTLTTTTGTNNVIGIAAKYVAAAAAAVGTIPVYDDPNVEFVLQCDADSVTTNAFTANNKLVGQTAPFLLTAGSTTSGKSKVEIDSSAFSTDTNDAVKVLKLYPEVGNSWAVNCDVICRFQRHALAGPRSVV